METLAATNPGIAYGVLHGEGTYSISEQIVNQHAGGYVREIPEQIGKIFVRFSGLFEIMDGRNRTVRAWMQNCFLLDMIIHLFTPRT